MNYLFNVRCVKILQVGTQFSAELELVSSMQEYQKKIS